MRAKIDRKTAVCSCGKSFETVRKKTCSIKCYMRERRAKEAKGEFKRTRKTASKGAKIHARSITKKLEESEKTKKAIAKAEIFSKVQLNKVDMSECPEQFNVIEREMWRKEQMRIDKNKQVTEHLFYY